MKTFYLCIVLWIAGCLLVLGQIAQAQAAHDNELNHWLVSVYIVW